MKVNTWIRNQQVKTVSAIVRDSANSWPLTHIKVSVLCMVKDKNKQTKIWFWIMGLRFELDPEFYVIENWVWWHSSSGGTTSLLEMSSGFSIGVSFPSLWHFDWIKVKVLVFAALLESTNFKLVIRQVWWCSLFPLYFCMCCDVHKESRETTLHITYNISLQRAGRRTWDLGSGGISAGNPKQCASSRQKAYG